MTTTGGGGVDPTRLQILYTASELLEAMRELKDHSGLTFRQIEDRAAANGEVLARSTLADTLRRPGLPKPEVLAAFVRACEDGARVDEWLAARQRIADALAEPPPDPAPPSTTEPADPSDPSDPTGSSDPTEAVEHPGAATRPRRRRWALPAALVAGCLIAAGTGLALLGERDHPTDGPRTSAGPAGGPVRIRPASAPALCLTEGRDPLARYSSAIAAQRPCGTAVPPRTVLEALGGGLYRIRWVHPEFGEGCLTLLRGGPAAGLLEPREDCEGASRFRIEQAAAGGFLVRAPGDGSFCVGMADTAGRPPAADAAYAPEVEAVEQPCAEGLDRQRFLIDPS
ncbi:XRE family transcriptional regulator [Kitasatospora sp. NPDC004240]